jgi:hypothetical protein
MPQLPDGIRDQAGCAAVEPPWGAMSLGSEYDFNAARQP